jgi:hypothetical protein
MLRHEDLQRSLDRENAERSSCELTASRMENEASQLQINLQAANDGRSSLLDLQQQLDQQIASFCEQNLVNLIIFRLNFVYTFLELHLLQSDEERCLELDKICSNLNGRVLHNSGQFQKQKQWYSVIFRASFCKLIGCFQCLTICFFYFTQSRKFAGSISSTACGIICVN